MIRLIVRTAEEYLRFGLVPDRDAILGSAPDNDLPLPIPGVSRRHARLRLEGGILKLWDLGSKKRPDRGIGSC